MLNQIDLSKKTPKGTYAKQFDKKSAELGYLGRALRDAKVEQHVVRGGAPLCDGFQNASLVLRLPQCAER